MGQDSELTELSESRRWYRPVETRQQLPAENLREGELCLVVEEGSVYEVRSGGWRVIAEGTVDLG